MQWSTQPKRYRQRWHRHGKACTVGFGLVWGQIFCLVRLVQKLLDWHLLGLQAPVDFHHLEELFQMLGMALNSQFTLTQNHVPPFQGQLISSLLKYLQRNLVLLSPRRFQHVAQVVMLCKTKNIINMKQKSTFSLG